MRKCADRESDEGYAKAVFNRSGQSCETEWSKILPQHAPSAWLGHRLQASQDQYLMVTDEVFDAVTGPDADDDEEKRSSKSATADQCNAAERRRNPREARAKLKNPCKCRDFR